MEICTMVLKELNDKLQDKDMAMHLTPARVSLRKGVAELLGLQEGDRVRFKVNGRTVMVGKSQAPNFGYKFKLKSGTVTIFNSDLSRSLLDFLKSYGYYRVEAENRITDFNGETYYSIFFRKYE